MIVLLTFAVVPSFGARLWYWSSQSPGDILIPNWSLSRSAALDIKVIHPLNNSKISDAGQTSGASAAVSEQEKLDNNALGCLERG